MNSFNSSLMDALERAPQLAMMVSEPPISFHRSFVDLTGSITAALLMSACLDQFDGDMSPDGWVVLDAGEMEDRTGLSAREQLAARRVLREKHLLQERKAGFPARLEVRFDYGQVSQGLVAVAQSRIRPVARPVVPPHLTFAGNPKWSRKAH